MNPAATDFTVVFTEANLPSGSTWDVAIYGPSYYSNSSTGTTMDFQIPNGSYFYEVSTPVANYYTAYHDGDLDISGAGQSVDIPFYYSTPYQTTFQETGLPSGSYWQISVENPNDTVYEYQETSTATIVFNIPNGTYDIYPSTEAADYYAKTSPVTFTVSGASQTVYVPFYYAHPYQVKFTESGLPSGSTWNVYAENANYTISASSSSTNANNIVSLPNGTYNYDPSTTAPNYFPVSGSWSFTVSGAAVGVSVPFHFLESYPVTFSESGLPAGSQWAVYVYGTGGGSNQSTGTTMVYKLYNGTYDYQLSTTAADYYPTDSYSSFVVSGSSTTVYVHFYFSQNYAVTFSEIGLPSGGEWDTQIVNQNGSVDESLESTVTTMLYNIPNGTYTYWDYTNAVNYYPTSTGGSFVVNGASLTVYVHFYYAPPYQVVFRESGLPASSEWGIEVEAGNGSIDEYNTSTTMINTFEIPNGSYDYYPSTSEPNYYPTVSYATFVVAGASLEIDVSYYFLQPYQITFNETGLPIGSSWVIGIWSQNYTAYYNQGSNGVSDIFEIPNGSYHYYPSTSEPNYYPEVNSGSFSVTGANKTIIVKFYFAESYQVTFSESGLPSGTEWGIGVSGTNSSYDTFSTGTSLQFDLQNGTYSFFVFGVAGYDPTPSSGSFTVRGAAVSMPTIIWSEASYSVIFTESGLTPRTKWSVTLNGVTQNSTATTITFTEVDGTYSFTVGNVSGWRASVNSGSVTVYGGDYYVPTILWTRPTYAVTFTETGLPWGTNWAVGLGGFVSSSMNSTIVFIEPNGTFAYIVGTISGWAPSSTNGLVTVNGATVNVTISWTQVAFAVTFTESGLPAGTSWSVTLNGATLSSSTAAITFTEPEGSYAYAVGSMAGYAITPSSGVVTVFGGDVSVSVTFFSGAYAVTFAETGLSTGTSWTAVLNGSTLSSSSATIAFGEPNGTYLFAIEAVSGYSGSPSYGTVTVNGSAVTEAIAFTPLSTEMYAVEFDATGLPAGTNWSVTVGGAHQYSTGGTMTFSVLNGSYQFTIGIVDGYLSTPSSGFVTVNGEAVTVPIDFSAGTQVQYSVVFAETGLAPGTDWSVTLGGTTVSSSTPTIVFVERSGTYAFTVGSISGYGISPASGSTTVNGKAISVAIAFTLGTYSVTFSESGLPSGTSWSVTLGGVEETSTGTTITFSEPNGTYSYAFGTVAGYVTPVSGTLTVKGAAVSPSVSFASIPVKQYLVEFNETGLPAGTNWSVTLDGVQHYSTSSTIAFTETNGTCSYSVGGVSGYTMFPTAGTLAVRGNAVTMLVQFRVPSSNGSGNSQGLSGNELYAVIAGIVVVIVIVVLVLLMTRRGRRGSIPKPEEKPATPPREEAPPAPKAEATPPPGPASPPMPEQEPVAPDPPNWEE
jgi:hypothetical protein